MHKILGIVIDTEIMTASISKERILSTLEELQHFLERIKMHQTAVAFCC